MKGQQYFVFLSHCDSLGGAENVCLYPSEKDFHNGLFCQDFLMTSGPFGCLIQRTTFSW